MKKTNKNLDPMLALHNYLNQKKLALIPLFSYKIKTVLYNALQGEIV